MKPSTISNYYLFTNILKSSNNNIKKPSKAIRQKKGGNLLYIKKKYLF